MNNTFCPNCHTHDFEFKATTGSKILDIGEKILVKIGFPTKWFKNLIIRCTTCKSYWRV